MSTPIKVAVIGAGVSGIVTAKCLIDEGIQPVVFEKTDTIGGLWNFNDTSQNGGGPAYQSLRTNTSKRIMSFSDFPFPDEAKDYPFWTEVLDYLHAYVDYFHIQEHILFNTPVIAAKPFKRDKWEIKYKNGNENSAGIFDALIICSGKHQHFSLPDIPGLAQFQGQVSHSIQYKDPVPYTGKKVLVVGAGASSVDIATEITGLAEQVMISMRSGAWITPRYIGNYPADYQMSRFSAIIPNRLRTILIRHKILREYRRMGIHGGMSQLGLPEPEFDLNSVRLTPSSDLISSLMNNEITVKTDIEKLKKDKVIFTDGSAEKIDAIIFGTGYSINFPYLSDKIIDTSTNDLDLYKYIFHPDKANLAFIGICNLQGPFPPLFEMQARWVARVFSGKCYLPSREDKYEDIEKRKALLKDTGAQPMTVTLIEYLDEMAREINVKPKLLKHIKHINKLLFGPFSPSHYRIDGPGSWKRAIPTVKEI